MKQRLFLLVVLLFNCISYSYGQNGKTAIIKGALFNKTTRSPFNDLKITIPDLSVFTTSDGDGKFVISEVPYGKHIIVISSYNVQSDTISVNIDQDVVDLDKINITPNDKGTSPESVEIPTIALEDNNTSTDDEDGVSVQPASGVTIATRDPFISTISQVFGYYRFQPRGYRRSAQEIQVNGIPVNDVETGNASWGFLGGLNDVFHGRDIKYGLTPSEYTFGGINGSTYFDATAADQRQEIRASYTITDRTYRNRVMLTANSGISKNGWAFSGSFARKWAEEGYIPGTFYDGYAYYGAVSKVMKKGRLNFTTFGSPTKRGLTNAATDEVFALAGDHYYNHCWGYMPNGQKRNAAVQNTFQPTSILNYEYKPNENTRWNTAIGYEFGKDKRSGLYTNNGTESVVGDYYKNLPSYYLTANPPDSATAKIVRNQILADPSKLQVDWTRIYQDNALSSALGQGSIFVLGDRVADLKKYTFNTNMEHSVNENVTFYGGITATTQSTENYVQVTDLLGGDHFVNYNQFATQQFAGTPYGIYNNLNNPNALIHTGDKIGYDYTIRYLTTLAWAQAIYTYDKFNFFISAKGGEEAFSREGFMKNGLFPNNSFGKSATHSFFDYGVKGGAIYKIDPRDILFVNAAFSTSAPSPDNTYISDRTRDFIVSTPSSQRNKTIEGGYLKSSPKFNARVTGYVTDVKNATEIKRFYNDDPAYNTFVNYVLQGENTRSIGTEIALNYKISHSFDVTGVAAVGQAFYTNRPNISVYLDNDTLQQAKQDKAYINNYYLATGPQSAYSLAINYRPRRDIYVSVNGNYFDRNYVEINPNRRTQQAADLVTAGSPLWHQIFDQEKLPAAFTMDLRAGKTFQLSRLSKVVNKVSHNSILAINGSVSNLLNNTNVKNTGYEQLRYDFTNINPNKFANKYLYAQGINFAVNVSVTF